MEAPSSELWEIFCAAATEVRVPATLLAAIAWQESKYDPKALGIETKAGWKAKGLMQLGPDVIKQMKVSDPFDVRQNVLAAAKFVRLLYLASDHNTDSVLASYVWGIKKVNAAQAAKKRWPVQVQSYVDAVLANRRWLQEKAPAVGDTATDRLANAIKALASCNPVVPEIQALHTQWLQWVASAPLVTLDIDFLKDARREWFWNQYALRYEQAPVTSITSDKTNATPEPSRIAPTLWSELLSRLVRPPRQMSLELDGGNTRPAPTVLQAEVREVEGGPSALMLLVIFGVWFVLQMGPRR